jgi:hypothetical protein
MKAKLILSVIAIGLVIISCKNKSGANTGTVTTTPVQSAEVQTTEASAFHKYGIKSGIVTFETDMISMKIKSVLYFDDYGTKEADEKYVGEDIKSVSVCDGKERYEIYPAKKTAISGGSCSRGIAYRFAWDDISKEDQGTKAKMLSNMNVAGKDCEAYSYDLGSSIAVYAGWKNINLYLKTTSQIGDVIMQAVKIEENVEIPAYKFLVPSGYEIQKSMF